MSFFNCSVSEAIHGRKIKFLNKLQLSDNILFKTFAKNISEELVSLSSIDAAIFWDIVMDIGCYFLFSVLVKLIKYLYFILVVWLNLYYHYWWNKDDHNATPTCTECSHPTSAQSWLPVQHHNSSERSRLAAGQAPPHHLQSRNSDAPSSSSLLSTVLGWPRRIQLNRLTLAALLHYDQSSCDTENLDPDRKMGILCLQPWRVEQSSSICPHHRFWLVLPPCSQNLAVPARF